MIPTVAEERAMLLHREIPESKAKLPTRWRQNGPILSLVFFVLTCVGVVALYGFFSLLGGEGVFTAVLCIGLAEYLILGRRFFGTGVESALWIGGLFAFLIYAFSNTQWQFRQETFLLFALAAAVAGVRLRNAWFGAMACALVIGYLISRDQDLVALGFSLALAAGSMFLLGRPWKRPSTERLLVLILLTAPILGAIAGFRFLPRDLFVPYLCFAGICFTAGILLRHHAPLLAGFVGIALTVIAARHLLPWTLEWQLIAGGAILLAVAAVITRALRDRTTGIVTTPANLTPYDEALQIGATIALTPATQATHPEAGPAPQRPAGGGSFGGAGSTGEF